MKKILLRARNLFKQNFNNFEFQKIVKNSNQPRTQFDP